MLDPHYIAHGLEWDSEDPSRTLDGLARGADNSKRSPWTGMKRARSGDIRRLMVAIGLQAQQGRELLVRAQELKSRIHAHEAFLAETDEGPCG